MANTDPRPLQACVSCGTPSRRRWCSDSCMRADGEYPDDFPADGEREVDLDDDAYPPTRGDS